MAAYKKMYLKLLGAVSDAIELLQKSSLEAEEIYISSEEVIVDVVDFKPTKSKEDEKRLKRKP